MAQEVRVPFIDLKPWVKLVGNRTDYDSQAPYVFGDDVCDLLDARDFVGGPSSPTVQKFEAKLAAYLGVPYVVSCANGTDALMLALRAHGIKSPSRVAIPNLTFWATYEAVVSVGATPILLDISPQDLQLDFDEFARQHQRHHFAAVVLVHLYGWCSRRLNDFREFCRMKHIVLIEDGAQAFGVKVNDASIFAGADVAAMSFHPAKVLGGIGDGGAVVCKSSRVASRVRLLANHGRIDHYQHITPGWNSRLDAIQAAWLTRALDVIDDVIENRRRARVACGYADWSPPGVTGNGYLDVSLANDRDAVRMRLRREHGVETGCVYPSSIVDQDGATGAISLGSLSVSRDTARKVYNRPLFYGMTDTQVAAVNEAAR